MQETINKVTRSKTKNFTNLDMLQTFIKTDFIPVVFWGKSAEIIGNSLKKGSKILVDGRIQVRSYDAKDGSKRWVTEVIGRRFEYMESKSSNASSGSFSTFGKEEPVPFNEPFDEEIQF